MTWPRLTIARLMALTALAAVDLGVARVISSPSLHDRLLGELIVFGVLPMANVLGIGLAALLAPGPTGDRPRPRPGLVGFEVAGAAALGLFLAAALAAPGPVNRGIGDLLTAFGLAPGLLKASLAAALILLPQLAAALLGAWANRTYKIRLTVAASRRDA